MPRLKRVSGRKLSGALQKGGFELVRVHGSHAFLRHHGTNRTATVPLTRKRLPVGTIAAVLKQAGLTAEDLERLLK